MKRKVMLSLFVIFLAAAIIGGATMAWFTAKADAPENTFTAGKLMIEAEADYDIDPDTFGNVNPGDCFVKCLTIENTGTKGAHLRFTGFDGDIAIDWNYINMNWSSLCFTELEEKYPEENYSDLYENGEITYPKFEEWVKQALETGPPSTALPPQADDPNHPYAQDALITPVMTAPLPESEWALVIIGDPFNYYMELVYIGGDEAGILAAGDETELCLALVFDGPYMDNLWQGAEFQFFGGTIEAIQTTNDAPEALWGDGTWGWSFYKGLFDDVESEMSSYELLNEYVRDWYADYFYDDAEVWLHCNKTENSTD